MATSKKTKTKKIPVKKIVQEVKTVQPALTEDSHMVVMSTQEALALVQLLGFSNASNENLAKYSLDKGDEAANKAYSARAEMSRILHAKITLSIQIGEPHSRDVH
jgi:hypothetical protein